MKYDSHKHDPLILHKVAEAIQWRKDSFLNNWTFIGKKKKISNCLSHTLYKINSKSMMDLNTKYK